MIYVFDLDGTLIDSEATVRAAYEMAGTQMPDDAWGKPWQSWCGIYYHSRKCEFYNQMLHEIPTLPPMDLLKEMTAAGENVGILTGASHEALAGIMHLHGIDGVRKIGWSATLADKEYALLFLASKDGDLVYIDDEPVSSIVPMGSKFVQYQGQDLEQLKKDVWIRSSSPQART